ncbi:MAG TPA: HEAT repeat domain-containing protein [Tepidisphaeraceae bacterium]|nr:HEAT repeat domain-containing protein [Tepidisphaeraceae bacterium]
MTHRFPSAFVTLCCAVALAGAVAGGDARAEPVPDDGWGIPPLIESLSDPDTAVRKRASDRLIAIGTPARPQVLEAAKSDDPERRAQAAAILKQMPWEAREDPPEVRAALERYGPATDSGKIVILRRLDEMDAVGALLRLLNEEPSDRLRWSVVMTLWDDRSAKSHKLLREMVPAENDPPALTLAGRVWFDADKAKALAFLRRAIDAEAARPSDDSGLLAFAYDQLVASAIERHAYDEAAELLRRQVPRDLSRRRRSRRATDGTSPSLAKLLALHEYFGPLEKFEWDRRTWPVGGIAGEVDPVAPDVAERVTRLFARLGVAPPVPLRITAELEADDRYAASAFLVRHELSDAAEAELRLALAARKPRQDRDQWEANLLFLLAQITGARDEDDATAELLQRALTIKNRNQFQITGRAGDDDVWAELHWRRARAAQKRGDVAAAEQDLKNLKQFTPSNTDTAIGIVNWLKETNRPAQARDLFDRIYEAAKIRLDASPAKAGPRNDLAWLCARTGERLKEARDMAQAAVDEMPDNGAFLDTLAEATYRLGDRDKAIELELRAMQLSPDKKFMTEQLERFRAGKP